MRLDDVMSTMTLRMMETADTIWHEQPGSDGLALDDALGQRNYRAIASMVCARMRLNGNADATIDDALDVELETGETTGEPNGDGVGEPRRPSPVSGT